MAEPLDFSSFAEPEPAEGTAPLDFSALSDPDPGGGEVASPEDDGPSDFMRGLGSTVTKQNPELYADFLEGASYRAPEGLRDTMRQGAVELRALAGASPEAYKRHTDNLVDSLLSGDIGTWAMETLGSGVGSMLPSMIAAVPGAVVGSRVAKGPGAAVGGIASSYALGGLPLAYGEVYRALLDEKVDPARAGDVAWIAAPIIAGLDTFTPGKVISRLGGLQQVKKEAARRIARRIAEEGIEGAKGEFITEAAQAVVQDATVSLETDKPFWTAKNLEGWIEEGVAGGLTGGVVRGAAGVRKDQVTPEGTPTPPGTQPPTTIPPITVEQNVAPTTTPEAVAPQTGTGTTGSPTKPAENVDVGNPQSAPTRSATTAPKTKKGKGKAKAEEIAAKAAKPIAPDTMVALEATKPAPTPQAAPEVTAPTIAPTPVAPVDDGAADMAKRFAPVNATQTAPQPIDTAPAAPLSTPPLGTPEEAVTPGSEPGLGTPEPGGSSVLDFSAQAEPEVAEPVTLPKAATKPGTGPKGRRVLMDVSKDEAGKTKKQRADAQLRSALNANLTDKTAGPKGTRHDSKAVKAAKVAGRSAAQKLMDDNKPSEAEKNWAHKDPAKANASRQAIFNRVEKFLAAVPDVVKKSVLKGDPETFPAPEVMVREALDFTKALKERDPKLHRDFFLRYLDREARIRAGDVASVLRDRRDEGDQHKRAQQKGVEQIASPTGDVSIEAKAEAEAAPEPTAIPDQVAEPAPATEEEGADAAAARPAPENIAATKEQEDTFEGRGTKVARSIKTFDEETAERVAKTSAKVLSAEEKAKIAASMGLPVAGEVTPQGKVAIIKEKAAIVKESAPAAPKPSKAAPIIERVKKRKINKPVAGPAPSQGELELLQRELARQLKVLDEREAALGPKTTPDHSPIRKRRGELAKVASDLADAVSALDATQGTIYPDVAAERVVSVRNALKVGRVQREIEPTTRADLRNWNTNDARKWLAKNADLMRNVYSMWNGKRAIANHSGTLASILDGLFTPAALDAMNAHGPNQRAMVAKMLEVMRKAVGHVEVHFLDQADVDNMLDNPEGQHSGGYYDPTGDFIAITDAAIDQLTADPAYLLEIILHEAVHAATFHALKDSKHRQLVEAVMGELLSKHGSQLMADGKTTIADAYGFKNADEFLAEAMSNRDFQNFLMTKKISPGLAATLEMSHWKNATMWDAFVRMVAKFLGFNANEHTALEAAISLTERVAFVQNPTLQTEAKTFYDKMDASRREGAKLGARKIMEIRNRQRAAQMKINGLDRPAPGPVLRMPDMADVRATGSAFENFRKRVWVQIITLDQMRQQFADSVFGDSLKQLTDAIANQGPTIQKFKQEYAPLAQEFFDYARDNRAEAVTFARVALGVRAVDGYVVEGGDPATINQHASNAHLGKRARRGWQAHARLPGLQRQYNDMSQRGRDLFQRMAKFYADTHNRLAEDSIRALLSTPELVANLNAATLNGLVQRTLNEQLTESDKQVLGEAMFNLLEKESSFHKVKGMYFPEMRYGDHVVVAKDKISDTMGGTLEADGETVTFKGKTVKAAEKLAEAFVKRSNLKHLSTKTRYYDAITGKEVKADDATGLNDVEYGVSVHMQTKGVYMFESHAAAARYIEEDPDGYGEDGFLTKTPEDRLGDYQAHLLTGTQMATIMSSVNKRLEGSDNEHHRALVRSILNQAAARMLSGNRIVHRRLKSKHVTGASHDFARNVFNYGDAAARHIATAKAMPKIRGAMDQMRDQLKDYYGKDRGDLVRVFKEVQKRVENGTIEPNEASPLIKNALAVSFFARLASPAHSIINSLQVMTVALPQLGGRFGMVRAAGAITNAYEDVGLGENAIAGLVNTAKAGRGWNRANLVGMNDLVTNGRDHIAKLDDGADLVKMFDTLVEGNAISIESGFEIGSAVSEGKGVVGTTIAKVDRIVRQLPQSVEYVNRTVTAIASYRLARESGMNHEKATQFAFDTVKTTQGDYSNANAPRFFNHPWLRPAMQFRKYAQLVSYILLDNVNRTFAGATREERRIAAKQLAGVFAMQIAVAGALSLPGLELAKLVFLITAAAGLTDSWEDYEDQMRDWADETFGKTWGEIITSGGTRLLNIDVTSRMSMSDLWTFGQPDKNEADSVMAWLFRQYIGSPGTLGEEFAEGMGLVFDGQLLKGAEKMIPFKAAADSVKALNRIRKGEGDFADAALKVIGFTSANQANRQRETGRDIRAGRKEEARGKALANEYRRAMSVGARAVVRAKIIAFNKTAKNYKHKVPYVSIDKHRNKDYSKPVD